MRHFIGPLFVVALCSSAQAGGDDAKNLQGKWEVVELIAYGKAVDAKVFKGTQFVFIKDKLTITPPNDKIEEFVKRTFSFKLDPAKKPAEIDLTVLDGKEDKGKVSRGIYELKGDTLRWCQPDGPNMKDRPTEFKSLEKSGLYLFTLKRLK